MAKIVLGMGASHGPLLATPPEQWGGRVEADRRNPALAYRDGTFKFEELAKLRAKENLQEQIKLPTKQKRYDACQRAMAESARLPQSLSSNISGLPHAYGFIYRRIMQENFVPAVPLFINTFYPPNQPSVRRCFSLGKALADAIASWDADLRVAVIGSGGMSHFVVDEELDRGFLDAMQRKDADALISIPPYNFRSGTSELKNWIPVAGAMNEVGLEMSLIDYQPLYRSAAGTGSGMAFAYWS